MRCPLCKEVVEDKDTLQVHYITSCVGYRPEASASGSGGQAHGRTVGKVRFLWKKCIPAIDTSIFLFSTFDQVMLTWNESSKLYESELVEVKPGTYKDCQLVVHGDLYPTEPVVIRGDNETVEVTILSGTFTGVVGTSESLQTTTTTRTGSRDIQHNRSELRSHRYADQHQLESFSRMSGSPTDFSVLYPPQMGASVSARQPQATESRIDVQRSLDDATLKLRQEKELLQRDNTKLCKENEELDSHVKYSEQQCRGIQRKLDEVSMSCKQLQAEVIRYQEEAVQLKQARDAAMKRAEAAEHYVHHLETEIQQKDQEISELRQIFDRQQEDMLNPRQKQKMTTMREAAIGNKAACRGNVSGTRRSEKDVEIDQLKSDLDSLKRSYDELDQQLKLFQVPLDISAKAITFPEPVQQLGGGSYGDVVVGFYRGVEIAVKKFHKIIMKGHAKELCIQELSVCQRVRHPNIVFSYGASMAKDTPLMLLMELLEGSLQDLIDAADRDGKGFSFREMVDLASDIAAGIAHLHEQKPTPYIHGDIKTNNILVTKDMRAKVGDLGTTHVVGSTLTAGPVSPHYVATERLSREGGPPPSRSSIHSDIYSLGATLADVFSGKVVGREQRQRQIGGIQSRTLRSLCQNMVQDSAEKRPFACQIFDVLVRHKSFFEYKICVERRYVFRVGDQLTLVNVKAPV